MSRSVSALLVICAIAYGVQQDAGPADSGREKDVYAIYSLLLTNARTSHGPDTNARYLIAAATAPGHPDPPCVTPPPDRKAEFNEVLTDYRLRQSAVCW